jgi:hypothetical protein
MDHGAWLKLLGHEWTRFDNLRHHVPTLRRVLGVAGPVLPMMDTTEQIRFAALPDSLTVYRGCSARFLQGVSWSLNPDVARGFPRLPPVQGARSGAHDCDGAEAGRPCYQA